MTRPQWNARFLLAGLLLLPAGCGETRAIVSGKITYNQHPVTSGEVHFVGAEGTARSALIDPEGKFLLNPAPLGEVKVAVVASARPAPVTVRSVPKDKTPSFQLRTASSQIPPRYNSIQTSGLVYSLHAGHQTLDIELTD
jgi:hypothetical protein